MARRRRVETPSNVGGVPVMPLELVERGLPGAERAQQVRAQAEWFRAHGINPADWRQVHPVLLASWKAHGIPSSLERARLANPG